MGGGCPLPFLFMVDFWIKGVNLNFKPIRNSAGTSFTITLRAAAGFYIKKGS
jgi:hypothetical protein